MKTCPKCNTRMENSERFCPSCGTNYVEAVVSQMTSAANPDTDLLLDNLEEGLTSLDTAPLPTPGETARRATVELSGLALIFCLLAGIISRANIFYLVGIIPLIVFIPALAAAIRHRRPMGKGEIVVRASARIFAEDAGKARSLAAGNGEAIKRIDAMQQRIDEASARQQAAHARNAKRIWTITCAVFLLGAAGVGVLSVQTHAARQARAEYEQLPEWIKLRDSYLSAAETGGSDDARTRMEVIRAMTGAGETAEAEAFFFSHCQGKVGDTECAWLLVEHYRALGQTEALEAFTSKVSLRYDSDTRKIRSLKR